MHTIAATRARRVLIVDDNEDAAEMVALMLRMVGFETLAVHNGAQALSVAPDYAPTIVFLDLGMPEMGGFEVAKRMRCLPGLETVYIAALSGWGDTATRLQTSIGGFNIHLQKPAAMADLVGACKAADSKP